MIDLETRHTVKIVCDAASADKCVSALPDFMDGKKRRIKFEFVTSQIQSTLDMCIRYSEDYIRNSRTFTSIISFNIVDNDKKISMDPAFHLLAFLT